jgi:excisionase family DNA binding protein
MVHRYGEFVNDIYRSLGVLKMVTDNKEKSVMTVEEAGDRLGISRQHAYKLAREGQLPLMRLGRRYVIPKAAFDKWLAEVKPACPASL